MQTLKQGGKGADVRRWQLFLIGQGLQPGPTDGDFGPATHKATMEFQARYRLAPDGVVGLKTLGQAMLLGFEAVRDRAGKTPAAKVPAAKRPSAVMANPNWPLRPSLAPLTGTAARQKLFGRYSFRADPVAGNPENIRIQGSWEDDNIVRVSIPQLRGVAGAPRDGNVRFHRLAAAQLQAMWRAWEKADLLDRVLAWDGSFVPRFVRGSRSILSNHAFGTAFDINAAWNSLGARPALAGATGSVRELAPIANAHGFFWGGHFNGRPDGMHFEVAVLKG
jgi:peptidoglycan hydrolase-like protein with peptidoglycan-binding domain